MTLADATAILYGPVPKYDVVIDYDGQKELVHRSLNDREMLELIETETRPCAIFVNGHLLVKRVKP